MGKFKKLVKESVLPKQFYHATPKDNLASIKKEGLNPQKSQSSSEGVYLSNDEYTAANYANMRPKRDFILLEIDSSYLDTNKFGPDDYELEDFLEDRNWEYNGDDYYSVYDVPWEVSLEAVNQVVYYGTIPPKAIKTMESKFLR